MNRAKNSFYFLLLHFFCLHFWAQTPEKIKVRRTDGDFYFFQKGPSTDTVSFNKGDIFYMKVSKNNNCNTRIEIENGQLLKESGDTLFRLKHLPLLNYLHVFNDSISADKNYPTKKTAEKCKIYKVMINGSNTSFNPKIITVRFIRTDDDKVFLTNRFYFK